MSEICILIIGFVLGIASSIIATIIYSEIQSRRLKNRNRVYFLPFKGSYIHKQLNNTPIENIQTIIEYLEPNILQFVTTAFEKENNWTAKIFMNELSPETGYGSYEYENRDIPEWGLIEIKKSNNPDILLIKSTPSRKELNPVEYMMVKKPCA